MGEEMSNIKKLSPSLMCGDWLNLDETIRELENLQIKWLHIDIMDGHFVKNITFGVDLINQIKSHSHLSLDIHMMVDDPMTFIPRLNIDANDMVCFHLEAVKDPMAIFEAIKLKKAIPGLALLPETDVMELKPYIEHIGIVLQMLTEPGFYGKKIKEGMIEKIGELSKFINEYNKDCLISVDGSVSFKLAEMMSNQGANIFVAGTSSIYNKSVSIEEGVHRLRELIAN